ncbi:hypothetical protein JCM3766R1_003740 [Sporobolomyces carnicolor]
MQAVASASAGTLPPGEHHRRTPSHSNQLTSPHHSNSTPGAPAVRLPPVNIPSEAFLPVAFNPERRQSINSDPFLHAFSTNSDPSYLRRPSIDDPTGLFSGGFQGPTSSGTVAGSSAGQRGPDRTGSVGQATHNHSPRPGVTHAMPPPPAFDSHPNYQFGTSFAPPSHQSATPDPHAPPHPHAHSAFPGPTSTYRFGGPPINSNAPPSDAPSYFDYSMRRHSLTNGQSPTRFSSQPGSVPGAGEGRGGGPPSNASTKRKSSGEDDESSFNDGSYYPSQQHNRESSSYRPQNMSGNPPPNSKRKTGSVPAEKMNNLDLEDAHRNGAFSPAWDERRASDESYQSNGSQQGYSMFHPAQGGPPPPSSRPQTSNPNQPPQDPAHHGFEMRPPSVQHATFYDDQVGPRGSIARGMYEPEHQNFGRRPSIPSVSQMIQGQAPFYPGQAPHSAPPTAHHPSPSPVPPRTTAPPHQPSVQISSAPPHPRGSDAPNLYPVGPPPQWPTSAPLPPGHATRQGSASSLDPVKESPYSRSPELRISHKLAERKRRKEMAQLFDDLRESLPGDKGIKSSKWEILTKAVEFIGQMKAFNRDLQNDNQNLRHHLNLPQAQQPPHEAHSNASHPPHPLQPAPHPHPSQQQHHSMPNSSHAPSPRPHPSRTGSHASSHASNLSIDNGLPGNRE